jgi:hypothetical protein
MIQIILNDGNKITIYEKDILQSRIKSVLKDAIEQSLNTEEPIHLKLNIKEFTYVYQCHCQNQYNNDIQYSSINDNMCIGFGNKKYTNDDYIKYFLQRIDKIIVEMSHKNPPFINSNIKASIKNLNIEKCIQSMKIALHKYQPIVLHWNDNVGLPIYFCDDYNDSLYKSETVNVVYNENGNLTCNYNDINNYDIDQFPSFIVLYFMHGNGYRIKDSLYIQTIKASDILRSEKYNNKKYEHTSKLQFLLNSIKRVGNKNRSNAAEEKRTVFEENLELESEFLNQFD